MSGNLSDGTGKAALEEGVRATLHKPLGLRQIAEVLARLTSARSDPLTVAGRVGSRGGLRQPAPAEDDESVGAGRLQHARCLVGEPVDGQAAVEPAVRLHEPQGGFPVVRERTQLRERIPVTAGRRTMAGFSNWKSGIRTTAPQVKLTTWRSAIQRASCDTGRSKRSRSLPATSAPVATPPARP